MPKKITAVGYSAAMARAEAEPARARFWVGLDVGLRNTAVCVVDADGAVVHQMSMKSDATEIGRYLRKNFKSHVSMIGMETGSLSPHLAAQLRRQGFPVAVLDALQVHRVLSIKRNKTDTNDARGIAEITRSGREYLTEVYVKSSLSFEIRAYLIMRDRLVKQRRETEAMIRGLVRVYGGRIEGGTESPATYRSRAIDQMCLIADRENIDLRPRVLPLLDLCQSFYDEAQRIERELDLLAAANPVCRRFMEIPGVGTITALSFFSAIEDPHRFRHVEDVAAYLGLTPRVYQSGDSLTHGSVSKMGNQMTRTHLVSAATVMLSNTKSFSTLKDWGLRLSKRVGFNKAKVALARKLAIVMLSLWRDGTHFMAKAANVEAHRELMRRQAAV
ncbi:IS110 family RNA-guided transposase [Novosphingobium aerophilum]|uniref:IS110 family transposase n=1 Tax=Novosphingobium aerophilum TaxID=2839843 RepID=A0A7X1F526_9SPHN|nr:IS110 family transposase [Novosphingobium aerophilum]MBC2650488.1 IS110 family transposase [Novosphingobium aerophilum]